MRRFAAKSQQEPRARQETPLTAASDLPSAAVRELAQSLNTLLADVFALYMKTKNFHWHMNGAHFREYHELLDEHAAQILAMVDPLAERVRKLGADTLKSIGQVAQLQRIADSEAAEMHAQAMLAELLRDNRAFTAQLREAHEVCDRQRDVATASLLETWIDESERRAWFLFESVRDREEPRH